MSITAQHYTISLSCDGPRHREASLIMRVLRMRTEVGYNATTRGKCVTLARAAGWRIGYRKVRGGHVPAELDGLVPTKPVVLCPACNSGRPVLDLSINTKPFEEALARAAGRAVKVDAPEGGPAVVTVAGVEDGEPTATFDNDEEADTDEGAPKRPVSEPTAREAARDPLGPEWVGGDIGIPADINPDEEAARADQ